MKKVNTNEERGLRKTEIEKKDIIILKNFIKKVPESHKGLITELKKSVSKYEGNLR